MENSLESASDPQVKLFAPPVIHSNQTFCPEFFHVFVSSLNQKCNQKVSNKDNFQTSRLSRDVKRFKVLITG